MNIAMQGVIHGKMLELEILPALTTAESFTLFSCHASGVPSAGNASDDQRNL